MSDWITVDAGVLGGKPCIGGTRLSVEFVLELLASGAIQQDVLRAYPQLTAEGLSEALRYAARAVGSETVREINVPA